MRKILNTLLILLLVVVPVAADNQIVDSPRAALMSEDLRAYNVLPESYQEQLGLDAAASTDSNADSADIAAFRLLTASGDSTYPVTPGDVYRLSYTLNSTPVVVSIQIPASGDVYIPSIGSFSWSGKSFVALKSEIEAAVTSFYPYSNPSLSIVSTGIFQVVVSGEVSSSSRVSLWGLSRLSDTAVLASRTASTRDVTVIHSDGTVDSYDLYRALREGDDSENPLLAPGDRVIYNRRGAEVIISGAVEREGTYQILEGETLDDLVMSYARGLSSSADSERITVQHYSNGSYSEVDVAYGDAAVLADGDIVYVSSAKATLGSVTLEGALVNTAQSANFIQGNADSRYFFRFAFGDTVLDMVTAMNEYFTASSDLEGVYMVRDGESIPLNFSTILHGSDSAGDMVLRNGDRFVIPFNQLFVTVNGAVNSRGRYGYVPGKDASYYISLAGGMSDDAKKSGKYTVLNKYGEKLASDAAIPSEAVITVEQSNFTRDLSIAVSVIGVVSTITTIVINSMDIANGLSK